MSRIDLKKNIIISGSVRAIVMLLSFITGWIITRWLGAEIKGRYSYLTTTASFIWLITDFGYHKSIPYLLRKKRNYISDLTLYSIFFFLGSVFLLMAFGIFFPTITSDLLNYHFTIAILIPFILIATVSPFNLQSQFLLLGLDKVAESALMQYWVALLTLAFLEIAILAGWNNIKLEYALWLNAGVSFIVTIVFLLRLAKKYRLKWVIRPKVIKSAYSLGFRAFISSLIISLMIRFDIILVRHFLDFTQVGIYSVAANIVNMIQLAANLVGSLLFVRLSDSKSNEESWVILRRLYIMFFIFLSVANLAFIIVGRQLLIALYGAAFEPAYVAYLFLIPASFGLTFGSIFNTYIWSKGFPIICIIMPLIALISNIALNIWWIPKWGIIGASLSTSVAYIMWFVLLVIYEHHKSGKRLVGFMIPVQDDVDFLIGNLYKIILRKDRRKK